MPSATVRPQRRQLHAHRVRFDPLDADQPYAARPQRLHQARHQFRHRREGGKVGHHRLAGEIGG
jgi:hypothetical protein